ncbi:unnamed protein product [Schistosoma curassoni]|uniref:Uncharacterized protein n=1 Tax=Schistosoma curassoni TaxID=6186 RepID=A0A183KBD3_9TREM|nr:unnamed protein product [Schistosoma curassoni]
MPSHDFVYTTTNSEVRLTAFSHHQCCLRNREDEKRISDTSSRFGSARRNNLSSGYILVYTYIGG